MLLKLLARRAVSSAMKSGNAQSDNQMGRTERLGNAWRVRDDALWNPFEVIALIAAMIFAFGFFLGGKHYLFVAGLFFPVILIGVAVVVSQTVLRRRAGDSGVLRVLRDRIQ